MNNKLRSVFSNEEVFFGGTINFKNQEARMDFQKALDIAWREGKRVEVKGIDSIETQVRGSDCIYITDKNENIEYMVVGPSVEKVSLPFGAGKEKKQLDFMKYNIKTETVLESPKESIVYLKLVLERKTGKTKITYEPHLNQAKNVEEIIESYSTALEFLDSCFHNEKIDNKNRISDTEIASIQRMHNCFKEFVLFYKKLYYVEQTFSIEFNPAEIMSNEESELDLEELYMTLKEGKAIRINEKIAELTSDGVVMKQDSETKIEVGTMLDVTFIGNITYLLWGKKIVLYTVNLVTNAIVKDIEIMQNNTARVVYGDEDSKPMYISYKGFRTEEEAKKEAKRIMDHKEEYVQAMTVLEYLNDARSAPIGENE